MSPSKWIILQETELSFSRTNNKNIKQETVIVLGGLPVHASTFFYSIVRAGDAIYVRVGDHDLTQKFGSPGAQTLRVATTYIHHNHNSQTLDNDIALLKLHGEATLKEGVCLACLPARGTSQSAGKRCVVTGYGYMGESRLHFGFLCIRPFDQSAIYTLTSSFQVDQFHFEFAKPWFQW